MQHAMRGSAGCTFLTRHRAVTHHRYRPVLSNISAGVIPARLRAASSSTYPMNTGFCTMYGTAARATRQEVRMTVRSVPGVRPASWPVVVAFSSSNVIPGRTRTYVDQAVSSGDGVRSIVKESGDGARWPDLELLWLVLLLVGGTGGRLKLTAIAGSCASTRTA